MVKLQKQFAYRYKAKEGVREHYKYIITIPEETIIKLGLKAGDELEQRVHGGNLILKPKKE